ncbi:TfoX/Sxy family protein [Listeria ivanovii]|uniref:TfoX/Sxy family protein n=2 Tax=Listeria ivanovii TaxID=1638 RepID=A0ABS1G320_LISIV|nr:TfoX/Sxy family protein [Listeria ivanovii]AIS61104.1 competence protein TfoX [Listeria ivanovii subsp. londoniensis]AIS63919.1 competence protein TfoX [Listeria ivanovii subsp. londoniensis]MBC2256431.1 TfoX/Sxy family protein [Listeria ivanovii]MBK1961046.1 TfoX/Sxy family protein [Listeria ivanovii subsp. londoniensis]MBK1966292.1 TfoX/Sxy family protein [Listeria ivanovii subsp. londoniensis]
MLELSELPNIGKVLEQELIKTGTRTPTELRNVGSKAAFLRIWENDYTACLSKLCALEGAIEGIRWHDLDEIKKSELKKFYQTL